MTFVRSLAMALACVTLVCGLWVTLDRRRPDPVVLWVGTIAGGLLVLILVVVGAFAL